MKITIEIDEGKCAIKTDDDVKYNRDPSEVEAEDDDCIRFGDVVGFKLGSLSNDETVGIVIDTQNKNAAGILYYDRQAHRLYVTYKLLDCLNRLKITYSEIKEDVMDWLTT